MVIGIGREESCMWRRGSWMGLLVGPSSETYRMCFNIENVSKERKKFINYLNAFANG